MPRRYERGLSHWRRHRAKTPGLRRGFELSNVVETALAKALLLAAERERWDIVEKIAAELEARRRDRSAGQNAIRAARNR